jgi:hypothetical protein
MTARRILFVLTLILGFSAALYPFQRVRSSQNRWARYEREMQDPIDDPPDAWEKREFAFGRLRFRSPRDGFYRARWGTDANKGERLFLQALRRLSRVDAQSIEEILDVDDDEMFNWPFMYAVGAGDWIFSPSQAERMRHYFERGGFLVVDDFHNDGEWADFMSGIEMMFPNPQVIEIADDDPIFHTVYDLSQRFQISGFQIISGYPYERGGFEPHWRAILDEKGRIVVAALHNQDAGDAWEWADYPPFPEKISSLAFRLGVNYVTYSLTH